MLLVHSRFHPLAQEMVAVSSRLFGTWRTATTASVVHGACRQSCWCIVGSAGKAHVDIQAFICEGT